jgi:AAA15 family ATPase/GTPase
MMNHITNLNIYNFKSIKKLDLDNCKRINLFVGKPNVGKSNILEAIALYGAPYSIKQNQSDVSAYLLSDYIRFEQTADLFYDQDYFENKIIINSNIGYAGIEFFAKNNVFQFSLGDLNFLKNNFTNDPYSNFSLYEANFRNYIQNSFSLQPFIFPLTGSAARISSVRYDDISRAGILDYLSPVKKYDFNKYNHVLSNPFFAFLLPPDGKNLFTIAYTSSKLKEEIAEILKEYNLEFLMSSNQTLKKIEIQKTIKGVKYAIPYSLIADTLQRYIFHLAAIYSNKESVILFEEPEAHTFPEYITKIAREIIKSETNQFFITSHSPYLVEEIIEKAPGNDVAVFACFYKDFQTVVRELTSEELSDIKKYDYDIISNIGAFEQ